MKITFKGEELNLVGISPGSVFSNFRVISQNMELIKLSDFKDKIKVITSFPSLDTPVCDLQVKEFNKISTSLSERVVVIGISCDLPFAQKRFCELNDIKNVYIFSDYKFHSFGINSCIFIKELKLLARTVFILDEDNNIRYSEIVSELTSPPNYEKALNSLQMVLEKSEKKWEEIKCCKWVEKEDYFKLDFPIRTNEDLDSIFEILSLIKEEKNIDFNLKFINNNLEVSIPVQKFNLEIGSIFERIVY
ncbi:MAG: thiol peroxidase [Candidatus Omnitrophica bacterium]|nr:thiol peroxidase [Candidatus Omnitrophota bacterium]MCM8801774.1 thiol peroxidase [Candidatus Omnitrophota bacterium]